MIFHDSHFVNIRFCNRTDPIRNPTEKITYYFSVGLQFDGESWYNDSGMYREVRRMTYQPCVPERIVRVDALYSLHYFNFRRGYVYPGERHGFWELVYADVGAATLGDDATDVAISCGQCCLHAPNAFHTIRADLSQKTSLFVISFQSESSALAVLSRRALNLTPECRRIIRRILLEAQAFCGPVLDITSLKALRPAADAPPDSGQIILNNLELLLLLLLRIAQTGGAVVKRAPITEEQEMQTIIAQAETFMRSRLDGSIRLDDVCRSIGVSRTTLKRIFRQCLDAGVMEHYRSLRLSEACRYLRTGRVNVSQIARQLGYSSLPAFSRQFKQTLGITPREYTLQVNDNVLRSDDTTEAHDSFTNGGNL